MKYFNLEVCSMEEISVKVFKKKTLMENNVVFYQYQYNLAVSNYD